MEKFKTCNNGHNYDAGKYKVCPYCPGNNADDNYDKTLIDFNKTQSLDDANSSQFDKTMINEETMDMKKTATGIGAQNPFKRTTIVTDDGKNAGTMQQSEKRKLVGWLVSFSTDEYGQDYKLYAGKNKIGSASVCDIVVGDSSISGEHTTILYRDNEFLIKDNFSTNGTKINGVTIEEGKLKEGDSLKLGNTTFKFKTVF